jgi:hypothetical protein
MIKLKMRNQITWEETRSGWNYVIDILSSIHDKNSGILFDGSLDYTFGYASSQEKEEGIIPYREDWIGFLHSTVNLCPFIQDSLTLDQIILSDDFLNSLENCKGIFTLSSHLARYISEKINFKVAVESLKHPTEFPEQTFNVEKFFAERKVIHVGAWLRKITSFIDLEAPTYKKIILFNYSTQEYLENELKYYGRNNIYTANLELSKRLSNEEYDQILSESIVFLNFCDCGVSNTVIECIVRNTPLLVNRLEPLYEYLGTDYPFYYASLEEAANKLSDTKMIYDTYDYLKNFPGKMELREEYFLHSFLDSKIIKALK